MNAATRTVARLCTALLLVTMLFGANALASSTKKDKDKTAQQASGTVDLNSASEKDLEALPGVGAATAKKIIAGRPYASVDDLKKAGVSSNTIEKIRPQVTASAGNAASSTTSREASTSPATKSTSRASASKSAAPAAGNIDLNSASQKDLESLPGVGPATAKKIIAGRPYASVDDLKKAGVSSNTIEKIRPQVTASASGAASTPASTATSTPPATQPAPPATASKGSMRSEEKAANSSGMPQHDNATPPPSGSGMVWVNLDTKVYHREGDRWYGKTKNGKYMSEAEAQKEGFRPSKQK